MRGWNIPAKAILRLVKTRRILINQPHGYQCAKHRNTAARIAPFKNKCAKHMVSKGSIHCYDYDEDVFPCVQKCLLHYFRGMYRTLKDNTSGEFSLFFIRLYCILKDAIVTNRRTTEEAKTLRARIMELISAEYQDPDCKRYVKRLRREASHLFAFLEHDADYHNNTSERALRAFAEYRKILYGNRSSEGARRTKILMSVYATCKARNVNFYEFLKDYLSGRVDKIPASPPPAESARCAVA